ncbi:hypothetical protein BDA99DRAFT_533705 [Phascolomyces articulosus]|uniref:Uncharacterized protein n=1 Tax=Phascolomyces articulosus TaxID=60185 RepID=A0AAD5PH88_9FUNG|nr:hypothetical protein BDA99DRAFT_533705 [Phascolomyces articulosus]
MGLVVFNKTTALGLWNVTHRKWDSHTIATNSLQQQWKPWKWVYACPPPWNIQQQTICKLRQERVMATLITLNWKSAICPCRTRTRSESSSEEPPLVFDRMEHKRRRLMDNGIQQDAASILLNPLHNQHHTKQYQPIWRLIIIAQLHRHTVVRSITLNFMKLSSTIETFEQHATKNLDSNFSTNQPFITYHSDSQEYDGNLDAREFDEDASCV